MNQCKLMDPFHRIYCYITLELPQCLRKGISLFSDHHNQFLYIFSLFCKVTETLSWTIVYLLEQIVTKKKDICCILLFTTMEVYSITMTCASENMKT